MKKSFILFCTFCLSLLVMPAQAATVNGVEVADTFATEGTELVLNGAGVRSKFMVKAYVAALYLQQKSTQSQAVIDADELMAVRLFITSGMINAKRMSESTRDGFKKSTKGNIAPIAKEIDAMISAFQEEVKEGDIFDLVYVPNTGVKVYRNGEQKAVVAGMAFKQAMLGIWISDNNIQKSLRNELMAGK